MVEITERKITAVVNDIISEVSPELIYLFGSRARGDMKPDSDVDLMVIDSACFENGRSRYNELAKLTRVAIRHRLPTDIVLYSRDEFDRMKNWPNHVVNDAVREGILLYAKS